MFVGVNIKIPILLEDIHITYKAHKGLLLVSLKEYRERERVKNIDGFKLLIGLNQSLNLDKTPTPTQPLTGDKLFLSQIMSNLHHNFIFLIIYQHDL